MTFPGQRAVVLLALAALLAAATAVAGPSSITQPLELETEALSIERDGTFDVVRLKGAIETTVPGEPELPLIIMNLALPRGTDAVGARAIVGPPREIEGSYTVRPAQPEVPLSRPGLARFVPPDEAIYSSAAAYPTVICELLTTGNMGGQRVASVAVYPVSYLPSESTLRFYDDIEIEVELGPVAEEQRVPGPLSARSVEARKRQARAVVSNPLDLDIPAPATGTTTRSVDYLIITDSSYVSYFQPLADWKTAKGVPAEIVTTDWVYATYAGVDNAERIRNCIIDYYTTNGTTWILLGGDTNVVPTRTAFAQSGDYGDDIRCDLYFADLDGTWNADGDNRWGEIGQDGVDLYADVYVGRAPAGSTTEATRFVDRILTYEGAPAADPLPTDYQLNMLFMAEVLWDSPWTDHAICKNMIDDDSVPARFDPITKLYETNGELTKSNVLNELDAGHNIINHNGHANWNVMSIGSSSLYRSDFDGLTNGTRYGTMYSIGCWASAIDYDCMSERWVNAPDGGGVAFVGNTRYGWGSPGAPGYGVSDEFDREFFDQLFNQGVDQIGVTNAAHRDAYVGTAFSNSYYRYCLYELVLLGDPEMRIWTEAPDLPATVAHSSSIPLGEHDFVVTISRDGVPIDGATVLISNAEIYESAVSAGGKATLHPAPTVEAALTVTITGPGMSPYQSTVQAVDETPDSTPPDAVGTLVVNDPFDTGGVVELDWSGYVAPADFAYYNVYREDAPFDEVSGRTALSTALLDPATTAWVDDTAPNGQPFYYAVTAVDFAGNEETVVDAGGPIAATNNARILLFDSDDGDKPFDGVNDDYSVSDGTEVPWIEALDASGELYCVSDTLPPDLHDYELVIYLGGIINFGDGVYNIKLTDDEAIALTDFIDGGGSVYVEEPGFGAAYFENGTAASIELWNRFHALHAGGNGKLTGNVQTLTGDAGSLTSGQTFAYDYQSWPDHFVGQISPDGTEGSSRIWLDQTPLDRGSLYVDPTTGANLYMVPLLLGGMSDGAYPSTRVEYVSRVLTSSGILGTAGVDGWTNGELPRLHQNAPNPFNPVTLLRFQVPSERSRVELAVYDVAGRLVATLVDGTPGAGEHTARWDGRDGSGRRVASGVYFARLAVDDWSDSRKMVLLK